MSPEQARGKAVDKRADIWAFGAVLYEMLTGRRVFRGRDVSETLAAVIQSSPEWGALTEETPRRVANLLRRCLDKEPTQRVQAAGDIRLALEGAFESPPRQADGASVRGLSWWQWASQLALVGVAAALVTGLTVWQ